MARTKKETEVVKKKTKEKAKPEKAVKEKTKASKDEKEAKKSKSSKGAVKDNTSKKAVAKKEAEKEVKNSVKKEVDKKKKTSTPSKTDEPKKKVSKKEAKIDVPENTTKTAKTKKVSDSDKKAKKTDKVPENAKKKADKKESKKESKKEEKQVEKNTKKKTTKETEKKENKKAEETKKEKSVAKKEKNTRSRKEAKPKKKSKDDDFFYGDDDDFDDILEPDITDDDIDEATDEITDEEIKLAQDLDLEDFNFENEPDVLETSNFSRKKKRVFKVSDKSEEIRKRFVSICKKYNSKDEATKREGIAEAIDELKSFVHYVIKKKYATYGKYYEDLVQEGIVGIIKGLEKYDPQKSLPTTFFNLYIIHEISKYIDTEVNKTTSHYSSNLTKINRIIEKFEQQGRKWNETDIAVESGLNMETVIQCLHIKEYKNEMYFENDEILEANISEHGDSPEQQYIKNERLAVLYKAIASLSPEEMQVIKYKYGLLGAQSISYKEIAKEMDVSIEKVRKYRHDAIKKLRNQSAMRSIFRDYVNDSETSSIVENDIAVIPDDFINHSLKELEELDIDFSDIDG